MNSPTRSRLPLFLSLLMLLQIARGQDTKPFLSQLSAGEGSPLYTTYAADLKRSEFTLDEGYHFMFYDSTRGADFTTDMAGDLCLAFKKGPRYVYELKEVYRRPVITLSYADMVKYTYFPFEDVKVDGTFFVYSSHAALQEVVVQNVGLRKIQLEVFPFLRNSYRTYENVLVHKDQNAITFVHEELPDDWVLEHKVPYADKVQDVLLFSEPPDRMTSFRSYAWGNLRIPQNVDMSKKPLYVVWGRVTHSDRSPCSGDPANSKLMALLNNDRRRILTESAPRWGSAESNFNRYSIYGIEMGNFGELKAGDRFTIMVQCAGGDSTGRITGTLLNPRDTNNVRIDCSLGEQMVPAQPVDLRKDIWGNGTEIRLYWKKSAGAASYNIYRRDYRSSGAYDLLADRVDKTFFTDKNIPGDKIYGYIVAAVDAQGRMSMHSDEINNIAGSDFLTDVKYPGQVKGDVSDLVRVIAAPKRLELEPGAVRRLRVIRAVAKADGNRDRLIAMARDLLNEDAQKYVEEDEVLYSHIPLLRSSDPDRQMLYWSANTLMRQVMLPPEGKCGYNYYVFSREPQWGWGHGGQVFHESLTMLAYAHMDPLSAMNSQRVFRERQMKDGYINYRTGPYLDESIPYRGQFTTSAPWYAWQNWEVYLISRDKKFLEEMYRSSSSFYSYYVRNRDSDGDGLCEWGGEAVLESVRDGRVAVWDQVGWPGNFEAVDLNAMLVKEAKSLAAMATELGYTDEASAWKKDAAERTRKINAFMWDEATGFYYHVDRKNHSFTFEKPNDLKREEIIGFLPLWAGIANEQQANRLVVKLLDPKKFWRPYGVPTLAADDPYYNPKGYWNGPVWVEWEYLIERGLLDYGFTREARELAERVAGNMIAQLKKDHNFWELYSPDDQWAGHHKTYIWAGLINRMLLDSEGAEKK